MKHTAPAVAYRLQNYVRQKRLSARRRSMEAGRDGMSPNRGTRWLNPKGLYQMKIVLTGGPSAGKTSLAEVLTRTYADEIEIVPEAASILFGGGFPRGEREFAVKCQQIAIYHVQKQLEAVIAFGAAGKALICDRGSLDGLAYWPGTEDEFFKAMGTTLAEEISRYDWVIHLETAEANDYKVSGVRTESSATGQEINARVKAAWAKHPRRIVIPNSTSFPTKIHQAIEIVRGILNPTRDK